MAGDPAAASAAAAVLHLVRGRLRGLDLQDLPSGRPAVTEAELQQSCIDLAKWLRVLSYHTHDSRRSAAGFPDLVLAGKGGVIFAELKSGGGILSGTQRTWKWTLKAAGADWQLWRPLDWLSGHIEDELRRIA